MHYRIKLAVLLTITAGTLAFAQTPEEIVSSMRFIGDAPNIEAEATMNIVTPQGEKSRTLEMYQAREGKSYKILVQIVAPGFLRNMKFLTHRLEDGTRSSWIKTSRGVRRLSDSNRSERLFDSDFTVEDLSPPVISGNDYTMVESEDPDIDVIEIIPATKGSEYTSKIIYIDKASKLLLRSDYFKGDTLAKQFILDETDNEEGVIYPSTCTMTDIENGTHTVLRFEKIESVSSIPARRFNKGSL